MFTLDPMQQLQYTLLRADTDTQKRLCDATKKLLRDSITEGQSMGMKCFDLVTAFPELAYEAVIDYGLLHHVVDGDALAPSADSSENTGVKTMLEVFSLALKSILAELAPERERRLSSRRTLLHALPLPSVLQRPRAALQTFF